MKYGKYNICTKFGFSKFYSLLFGIISAIAGKFLAPKGSDDFWGNIWIYTGSASLIVAYFLSKYFIEKKQNFSNKRLIFVAMNVGLLSHWLFWYEAIVVNYIKWKFSGLPSLVPPFDPMTGIVGAFLNSFFSLLYFGWIALPVSVVMIFISKYLCLKK